MDPCQTMDPRMCRVYDGMPEDVEMYPFYERGVRTLADVKQYLATWFKRVTDERDDVLQHEGVEYRLALGFRRAFTGHGVYVDPSSDRYVFVTLGEDGRSPPLVCGRCDGGFDGVVDDIARFYADMWGIED